MEAYTVSGLSFYYPEEEAPALRDISFSVKQGEFITLCGPSGCGKSTLLRQLKPILAPHGRKTGEVLFMGRPLGGVGQREQASQIGFVQQSPENQLVTDKVWHELAFGLESLGLDTPSIRARVAEMASFFGMETWFHKDSAELSGGQKQLLNLASIMVMQPSVLILDEPASQLDPIAAADFLATVGKINRELGTTVIMTEHRLEEALAMSDRALVMDEGRLIADGPPREVGRMLKQAGHSMFLAMPAAMRVWAAVPNTLSCPVTVKDGRGWLADFSSGRPLGEIPAESRPAAGGAAVELSDIWFKYDKGLPDVIKGLSLTVRKGEFFALLGGNGAGKTTALGLVGGLYRAYRGSVRLNGAVGGLPQNPQTLFVKKTLREDLLEIFRDKNISREAREEKLSRVIALCRLERLLDRHPYDLSGGEQQRAALAKVLLLDPEILLLDEPTKGLDAEFKQTFAGIIKTLVRRGAAVLMVSHDVEFCAEHADRCALFFDGSITAAGPPREFFSGNCFYTTSASRMARGILPSAVTAAHIIAACGGEPDAPQAPEEPECPPPMPAPAEKIADARPSGLPPWRKALAALSGAAAILSFIKALGYAGVTELLSAEALRTAGGSPWLYVFTGSLLLLAFAIARKTPRKATPPARERSRLSRRTIAAAVMILLLIPLTIFTGVYFLDGKKYYFIALLILLETMLPFFLVFEGRRPQARELAVIAVLCAIGVAGRAAFFMLPNFKPVLAIVIISGVAFGGETGFLVGAMTMLASNVLFGQGPWTPWQMFAMGIAGFLAGVLFKKGLLRRGRVSLCVFGALCAVVIYGGIMNAASAIMWTRSLRWEAILSCCATGFPMDLVHAAATFLVLLFAAGPMLEKLDRIKVKYGLME